jgi:SnoaL-like domain
VNDDEMVARIKEVFEAGDMESFGRAIHELAAEDMVYEFPQSGEVFRGRDTIAEMNANYPAGSGTTPTATLRRVVKPGQAWIIESTIDYGDGTPVSAVSIIELGSDGKIARQTDYFANPFPAAEWRAKYTESKQMAGV